MQTWWLFYAGLTLMALTLAMGAGYYSHARSLRLAGCVLAALYLTTNVARQIGSLHMLPYPFLDTLALACFVFMYAREREPWQALMVVLFGIDMGLHGFFFQTGDYRPHAVYAYDLSLNLVYIAQLATVAIPSAWTLYDYEFRRERV